MIAITSCQGLFGKIPLAVDSTRLSEPDTEIYTRGPEEPGAAQDQKKNKSERDLKFTWGINVKEHSRLSESYDLCKVYTGKESLNVPSSKGNIQRQWGEQACFQSWRRTPVSQPPNGPDAATSANLILPFSTQFLLFVQFLNFQGKVIQKN